MTTSPTQGRPEGRGGTREPITFSERAKRDHASLGTNPLCHSHAHDGRRVHEAAHLGPRGRRRPHAGVLPQGTEQARLRRHALTKSHQDPDEIPAAAVSGLTQDPGDAQ